MAESNRIVFPDEVEQVKAKVVRETEATKTNTIEEPPEDAIAAAAAAAAASANLQTRNMITVPSNCPPGQQMGADGVCRDIF